jgi:hypothetical protein
MRFKDFEIVIHGDFESGDDELDLRSAIAKKLGGLSAKTSDAQTQTVQKIEDGEARWAPPLQQHLDVVKQSLTNTDRVSENSSKILDLHAARQHYEKYHESAAPSNHALLEHHQHMINDIRLCKHCGHLIMGPVITESVAAATLNSVMSKWAVIAESYTGGIKCCVRQGKKCEPVDIQ